MRIIYRKLLNIGSTSDSASVTDAFPTVVPAVARLQTVQVGENETADIDFIGVLGQNALQANKCAVEITGVDESTDSQLRVDIERSLDGVKWIQVEQLTGFTTSAVIDVSGTGFIRARTTTTAITAQEAISTFMFTRTP